MVSEKDALELLASADENGIALYLDGGWGVDALLGEQTRDHDDIDLFLEQSDADRFTALLIERGFRSVLRSYSTESHTVWEDRKGRIVDLHLFERGAGGTILFEGGVYPSGVFDGRGRIGGREVRCIPPAEQVQFHRGYDFDANDTHDVRLLCRRFGIPLPEEYETR